MRIIYLCDSINTKLQCAERRVSFRVLDFMALCTLWASLTILRCKLIAAACCLHPMANSKQTRSLSTWNCSSCAIFVIETADELDVQQDETMEKWISAWSCIINDQTNNTLKSWYFSLVRQPSSAQCLRIVFSFHFHCSAKRLHKWRKKTTIMPTERKNENENEKKKHWKWIFYAPL